MKKIIGKIFLFILLALAIFILILFFWPPAGRSEKITWGTAYSKIFAEQLGLNWQKTYLAILDDLQPEFLRLPIYWSEVAAEKGKYDFSEEDWLVNEARKRNVKLILVIGQKLPRWPECYWPEWAKNESIEDRQQELLKYIKETVSRYKSNSAVLFWQVENEPFLPFGVCPPSNSEFLDKEITLVKSIDPARPIIITDSGELSDWLRAAKRADIFGTTMYRVVWNKIFGRLKYPLPPKFFWLKANLVHLFYPGKQIFVSELQAEPWGQKMIYDTSLEEQLELMNLDQFYDNIEYARRVGFSPVYLWGAEWWYWMKNNGQPAYWDTVKIIFKE